MFDINSLLVDKLEELDNKISKNSRNSSKAPSTDNKVDVKKNQCLRGKSGRKTGGQKGRKGSTLKKVKHPDHSVQHKPKGMCNCGRNLKDLDLSVDSSRQVFEIEILKK